jgi:hypothetical protein
MKIYRFRHKPTGLFWRPSKGPSWAKRDQLHKEGKIYTTTPDLRWLFGDSQQTKIDHDKIRFSIKREDMEIVEEEIN